MSSQPLGATEKTQPPNTLRHLRFHCPPLLIVQSHHFQLAKGAEERWGRERGRKGGRCFELVAGREIGLNAFYLLFRGIQVSSLLLEGKKKTEIDAYFCLASIVISPPPITPSSFRGLDTLPLSMCGCVCVCVWLSVNSVPQTHAHRYTRA